jgi:hypothetical protein
LATVLDATALLIVGSDGLLAAQARITDRMGLRLLVDLTDELCLKVDPESQTRLTEGDLPVLRARVTASALPLRLGTAALTELLRLNRWYDVYLSALSACLVITLPPWVSRLNEDQSADAIEEL